LTTCEAKSVGRLRTPAGMPAQRTILEFLATQVCGPLEHRSLWLRVILYHKDDSTAHDLMRFRGQWLCSQLRHRSTSPHRLTRHHRSDPLGTPLHAPPVQDLKLTSCDLGSNHG